MAYLDFKLNNYYATLTIPADVRHIIGRGVRFYQSTKCKTEAEAQRTANHLVAGWKTEIIKARGKLPNPKDTFWESLRHDYLTAAGDEDLMLVLEDLAEQEATKATPPP